MIKNFNLKEMGLKEMTRSEMLAVEGGCEFCPIIDKAVELIKEVIHWLLN